MIWERSGSKFQDKKSITRSNICKFLVMFDIPVAIRTNEQGARDFQGQTIKVPSFIKPYKSGINPKAQAPLWSPSRFLFLQVPLSAENKPSYWILIQFSPSFFIALPHRLPPGRNDYDCFCHNFFVFSARNPVPGLVSPTKPGQNGEVWLED